MPLCFQTVRKKLPPGFLIIFKVYFHHIVYGEGLTMFQPKESFNVAFVTILPLFSITMQFISFRIVLPCLEDL